MLQWHAGDRRTQWMTRVKRSPARVSDSFHMFTCKHLPAKLHGGATGLTGSGGLEPHIAVGNKRGRRRRGLVGYVDALQLAASPRCYGRDCKCALRHLLDVPRQHLNAGWGARGLGTFTRHDGADFQLPTLGNAEGRGEVLASLTILRECKREEAAPASGTVRCCYEAC
jgi:hypothetical protein